MSDLDDKLWSIVNDLAYEDTSDDEFIAHDAYIAQIKQAFTDAGYVKVPKEVEETWREYNHMAGYMTGQEWYDRFMTELKPYEYIHTHKVRIGGVLEAARKASSITKEEL